MNARSRQKRGRGRPALPPEEVKEVFPLRLSGKEKELFEVTASRRHQPLRAWIIEALKQVAEMQAAQAGEKGPR